MTERATQKQLAYIKDIQNETGLFFTGTTKEDAMKYLDQNIPVYKQILEARQLMHEAEMEAIDGRRDW